MPHPAWNKRLTPEIEQEIISSYQKGMSANEILKYIPFKTRKTIYDVLERHGVSKRSSHGRVDYKSYNQNIFVNIDSQEKAYWLGILLTDGYICDTRKGCELQVGLQMIDVDLLEKFKDFLGTNNPILKLAVRSERHQQMYRVVVNSKQMANDLSKYGIVPRKSKTTYLPILKHNLMPHLLRGILDGDGTISHRQDGNVIIGFCGTERLVAELRIWLISKLNIADNRLHKNESVSFIQWSHIQDVGKIVDYLYKDAEVYMERKFNLIKSLL